MRTRPLLRLQALLLLALLAATAGGAPSHHHLDGSDAPAIADAEHHSHGVQLVDLAERLTSLKVGIALPAVSSPIAWADIATVPAPPASSPSRPWERAPPPGSRPRAPPLPA